MLKKEVGWLKLEEKSVGAGSRIGSLWGGKQAVKPVGELKMGGEWKRCCGAGESLGS